METAKDLFAITITTGHHALSNLFLSFWIRKAGTCATFLT